MKRLLVSTTNTLRAFVISVVALAACVVAPTTAGAAYGDLTFLSCLDDDVANQCANLGAGVVGSAQEVATSRDGKSVYVTSFSGNRVIHFRRNSDGSLTKAGCFSSTATAGCTSEPGVTSLNLPIGVAVSDDGESVYVAGSANDAITNLNRDSDGDLTFGSCYADSGPAVGCTTTSKASLDGVKGVAVSPNGASVYALSGPDKSITWFDRAPSGAITYDDCIANGAMSGCTAVLAGLNLPGSMTISPNNANVYVTSLSENSVMRFARAAGGTLTFGSCNAHTSLGVGCVVETHGSLLGPGGVAISPGGNSLYTIGIDSKTITTWNVNSSGVLTFAGCFANGGALGCSAPASPVINIPITLALSRDGRSLYAVDNNALMTFSRATTGALSFAGCFTEDGSFGCATAPALAEGKSVAVSPDGENVYSTSQQRSAVSTFARDDYVPPPPPAELPPVPNTLKVKGPKKKIYSRTAIFKFRSTVAGSTYRCKFDRKVLKTCRSGMKLKKLKLGKHRLQVTATSPLGMVDPTPLSFVFTVKKRGHR